MTSTNYEFTHIHNSEYYKDPAVADSVKDYLDTLEVIYGDILTKRSNIEINSRLSHAGKSEARKELVIEIRKARTGWLDRLAPLSRQIEAIEKERSLSSSRPDDLVAALREREVRDHLRTLDPLDIENLYKDAAKNGDDLLIDSIENAPIPFTFKKGAELVEQIRAARLERKFPEQSAKLKDLNFGLKNLQSALGGFESNLRTLGLEIAADPVSDRAGLRVA